MTKVTQLYRHYDVDGVLLYVGISLNAASRLAQHKDGAAWFSKISTVKIEEYATREQALEAERLAIVAEKPLYNVRLNAAINPPPPCDPTNDRRFEFRLPIEHKRKLAELASEADLSLSDLIRLGVYQLLENPGVLLRHPARLDQHDGENSNGRSA